MSKCRWLSADELEDEYCVNGASEFCSTVPSEDDCNGCSHYFSEIDTDNIKNSDINTKELI